MSRTEESITELLSGMNLDQKAGQIIQAERQFISPREVTEYHIGALLSGGGSTPGENTREDWISMNDAYWAASMEEANGHLPIPTIYGIDATHGNSSVKGGVVFPHNIGLGATRDPDLIERIARATAREVVATGLEWTFAPTLAVARDDHWGRTYESYSEDPEIVSEYAERFIKGFQGDLGEESVIACAKHWIGDGGTEHGIDQGNSSMSEEELRRIHMPPYVAAIDAGVLTVMVSLSSWNGEKCHGNRYLLTDVLKGELGFQGVVISDWDGLDTLSDDYRDALASGLNAGLDMLMVTEKWKTCYDHVKSLVLEGRVPMARLDDAVRRILRVKTKFGMFARTRPARRPLCTSPSVLGCKAHRETAREAVRKSLVLLKNEDSILPLNKEARILVAGKNADNRGHQCGGFTVAWQGVSGNKVIAGGTSIWEGISAIAPHAVLSAKDDGADVDLERHDVAIVVIGEVPYAEMMGDIHVVGLPEVKRNPVILPPPPPGEPARDGLRNGGEDLAGGFATGTMGRGRYGARLELHDLHREDITTIRNIAQHGIPVIVIMVCGRPLVVNQELEESEAFVVAWLPGSEGQGVADVLFGDYDFQGKLSFSWPRQDNEDWNIGDDGYNPLFPYGYGLTYAREMERIQSRNESTD